MAEWFCFVRSCQWFFFYFYTRMANHSDRENTDDIMSTISLPQKWQQEIKSNEICPESHCLNLDSFKCIFFPCEIPYLPTSSEILPNEWVTAFRRTHKWLVQLQDKRPKEANGILNSAHCAQFDVENMFYILWKFRRTINWIQRLVWDRWCSRPFQIFQ